MSYTIVSIISIFSLFVAARFVSGLWALWQNSAKKLVNDSGTVEPITVVEEVPVKVKEEPKKTAKPKAKAMPKARIVIHLEPQEEDLEALKATAKAIGVKGYHLYKDVVKLKEAIAKKQKV